MKEMIPDVDLRVTSLCAQLESKYTAESRGVPLGAGKSLSSSSNISGYNLGQSNV